MVKHLFIWIPLLSIVPALPGLSIPENQPAAAPVYVANQNPFVQIFGLPKAEAGSITPKGRLNAGFLYFVSNNSISNNLSNGESIIWDGETTQFVLKLRYGVMKHLEVGMDIPWVEHNGGYLDSLIRNYHLMVGLPVARQELFDKDDITYQVSKDGTVIYSMSNYQQGLGDIRLTAAVSLFNGPDRSRRHLAVRSVLKLPTGNADQMLGSGGTDVAVGLSYSDCQTLQKLNTVLMAHLGGIYMGDADILQSLQRHHAGYGGLCADWRVLDWLEFKLQLDYHSAFYDSDLVQLGSSWQLLSGAEFRLPGDFLLDFGISQQLKTDATPDVGFYFSARQLF